jgi:hypothetical protein
MTIDKKTKRHTDLIAVFEGGYSTNLFYCLPEAFKDALDIKYGPRKKTDKKTKHVTTTYHWTQGDNYQFHRGDVFHSHFDAHNQTERHWTSIQVMRVFSKNGEQIDKAEAISGDALFLELELTQPDSSVEFKVCTPSQLVEHLKTGNW